MNESSNSPSETPDPYAPDKWEEYQREEGRPPVPPVSPETVSMLPETVSPQDAPGPSVINPALETAIASPPLAAAQIVGSQVAKTREKLREEGPARFFISFLTKWGTILLISGLCMAFAAWSIEQSGQNISKWGSAQMAIVGSFFGNLIGLKTPPNPLAGVGNNGWGGWNISQDLSDISSSVTSFFGGIASDFTTIGQDVATAAIDIGIAIEDTGKTLASAVTNGLPGAAAVVGGSVIFFGGWILEQVFPWLMAVGILFLVAALLLSIAHKVYSIARDTLAPRLRIRLHARLRPLQERLDHVLIPPRIWDQAQEHNLREEAIRSLAEGEASPDILPPRPSTKREGVSA